MKTVRPEEASFFRLNSMPMTNKQEDHADLRHGLHLSTSSTQPTPCGPAIMPVRMKPRMPGNLKLAEQQAGSRWPGPG
jgi:hypothetical protein